ncbi:MAG TPA: hypothetical protein VIJ71_06030 [Mycobacteriales bacterium]
MIRSVAAVGAALVVALAACGGSATPARSASTPSPSAPVGSSPASASGPVVGASNLTVTAAVRAALVAAIAAMHGLRSSDYEGLVEGRTYYAIDHTTGDYWAGAEPIPSASSYQAQVSSQDDGSYVVLTRTSGGSWHGYATGMTGVEPGSTCPVTVAAAVLAVWSWAIGSCAPPVVTSTPPASASPTAGLPVVHFANWTGRNPSIIYFSADSGNIVSGLTWSWTATQAVGHGTWGYESCNPSCAQGGSTPYPAVVTLSGAAGGQFTKGVEETSGPHGGSFDFVLPSADIGAS